MTALRLRHPELIGLGVDENTAIVVRGSVLTVLGKGCVAIYDGIHEGPARDDDLPREDFLELTVGDRYDLATRRAIRRPR
jgi:cyanophycinase-like exopeptidase